MRWFGAGAAVGLGAAIWGQRQIKAAAVRYRPGGLAGNALDKARSWPSHFRGALDEGRGAMRAREAELRERLEHIPGP